MRPQVISSNTPETPELETVNLKNILNQPQPMRPQVISSNTPETPELETVNIKDILKCSKNINPKTHIKPTASTITPEMPHLETTVLSNTTNTYKSPMVSKTIIDKSGTPETPEFTSDYMKTLLAARDKPKVQARPTPEFPDLNYLKKDWSKIFIRGFSTNYSDEIKNNSVYYTHSFSEAYIVVYLND